MRSCAPVLVPLVSGLLLSGVPPRGPYKMGLLCTQPAIQNSNFIVIACLPPAGSHEEGDSGSSSNCLQVPGQGQGQTQGEGEAQPRLSPLRRLVAVHRCGVPHRRPQLPCPSSSPVATRGSPVASSPAIPAPAGMSTVGELWSLAASHLDSLKRRLDALHGASVRDLEASHSRISKRVKMQKQGCLQLAEEADKEHRKMAEKIAERCEVVKTSYKKFVAEVQASTSRVCKVTVPEIAKSAERSIDGLRSRYNI